jgi:hypothetical protein
MELKISDFTRNFLKFTNMSLGFTSLFIIPKYGILNIPNLLVLLSFFFLLFLLIFMLNNLKSKIETFILFLSYNLVTYFSIFGAFGSNTFQKSFISSMLLLIIFLFCFISFSLFKNSFFYFLKGLTFSAIITSLYIGLEFIFFQFKQVSLNEVIFPSKFLDTSHVITFTFEWNGILLYKPAGFSWDPGMSIPALVIAYIVVCENLIYFKNKSIKVFILGSFFVAIFLSLSLTSILSLLIYLIILKFILRKNFYIKYNVFKINLTNFYLLIAVIFLFYISFVTDVSKAENALEAGKLTHLKYFSGIIYLKDLPFEKLLLGFGYWNIGEFFNTYVPWYTSFFEPGANPESTLVNLLLFGGLGSILFFCYFYYKAYINSDLRFKKIFIIIIFCGFGYSINTIWFNFLFDYLLIYGISKKLTGDYI